MEKRYFEVRSDDGNASVLIGHAAVFLPCLSEDLGGFVERINPGAFKRTLAENPLVHCLKNHNTDLPLGDTGNGSLILSEDSTGLAFRLSLPEGVSYACDLKALMQRGDNLRCSIGFNVVSESWDDSGPIPIRTLIDLNLYEISVGVVFPAYKDTDVALRSLAEARKAIEVADRERQRRIRETERRIAHGKILKWKHR
ncbi:MAG: major capsid protein [Planctomycetota bacterium]|nr:major capsid protein [Planctomycetota bacterium]